MNMQALIFEMVRYCSGHPALVQHFLKVHSFAVRIGLAERLEEKTMATLEAAAIVHDIGILTALEKHGSAEGRHQEAEGPPIAKTMLEGLRFPRELADRVCFLVGHHHTYDQIDGPDYQILIEADFLVNMHDGGMDKEAIAAVRRDIFRTKTGTWLCDTMFGLSD